MVAQLLVRDPRKRARVADLWIDGWMHGEGAPPPPVLQDESAAPSRMPSEDDGQGEPMSMSMSIVANGVDAVGADVDADVVDVDVDVEGEEHADDEGVLVDGEDIGPGHVARQEH